MIPIYRHESKKEDSRMLAQRAEFGVCETDVWSFDIYMAKVMSNGLKELARVAHGWPSKETWLGDFGFETYEEWISELNRIAKLLDFYSGIDGEEQKIWESIAWTDKDHQEMQFIDNGDGTSTWIDNPTENELRWRELHRDYDDRRMKAKAEALSWIVKYWDALWD